VHRLLFGALWLILAAPAAAAGPLERYAPVVVHASGEPSVLSRVARPGLIGGGPATVYARSAPSRDDGTWLQYWLPYADNPQDRGMLRTGRHAGDWELFQILLSADGRPREVVAAQHSGAERCPWSVVSVEAASGRPVVYAAYGSHATYLRPGVRDRTWPDPNDIADGRGVRVRPRVVSVTASSPAFMRFPGRWGGARATWPYESDSPRGPAFQGERWSDPDAFAASARGCAAERCRELGACDGRETLVGGALLTLGALLVGGAGAARRRHRRAPP